MDDCFKIDMGCDCPPPPPDTPRPFVFQITNSATLNTTDAIIYFTSNSSGVIVGYTINTIGVGYRVAPTITIGGAGVGATATCTINANGNIVGVTITNGGTTYGSSLTNIPCTISPTATNSISFDQLQQQILSSGSPPFKFYPLQRVALPPPAGGGITLATGKVNLKFTYTVHTNGATNFTGKFTVNGIPVATLMTIDNTNEVYTTVCHQSGELTLNYGDYISYEITSTQTKLYNIVSNCDNFSIKYI